MAGRKPKGINEEFYDVFADWDIEEQDRVLKMLTEIHRQANRQARRKKAGGDDTAAQPEGKASAAATHETASQPELQTQGETR